IVVIATTLLVIFYVGYLGSFCVRSRCWWPGSPGAWLILSILVVIKVTDIGAYFTGILVGRRLLIPKISPKKTWEGLIGGIAAAAVVSGLLLGWAVPRFGGAGALCDLSMLQAIVFGIVMAIVGQIGDLAESLFKRDSGAKDSARLVPTFGGVLDIIDSPLMAVPVAYWLLRWWLLG
ncbi:MAG TPA: phosphatidate cytidylyltransferase, partial [Phycisphaerae bacterium]|nr:phosphatidate cytidylyltransferase [Phycisphaerae bacterium]